MLAIRSILHVIVQSSMRTGNMTTCNVGRVQRLLSLGVPWTVPFANRAITAALQNTSKIQCRFLQKHCHRDLNKFVVPRHFKCESFSTSQVCLVLSKFDPESIRDEALCYDDWLNLKKQWEEDKRLRYRDFNQNLTNAVKQSIKFSRFNWGKSLLDNTRKETNTLPITLFNLYCYLCFKCNDSEGTDWCLNTVRRNQSMLDDGGMRSLMNAICQRDTWKADALELFRLRRDSKVTIGVYEPLAIVACQSKDVAVVANILKEVKARHLVPSDAMCLSIFSNILCDSEDEAQNKLNQEIMFGLLEYFRLKRHYISKTVAISLRNWFKSSKLIRWNPSLTRLSIHGNCKACGHKLETIKLTLKEFEDLRKQITEKVIYGEDIFQKTRPDELEAFTHFVKEGGPYDIVIDGLNVAHLVKEGTPARMLRQVIVYLVQVCGYKCLVLGRQHMLNGGSFWQQKYMDTVMDLADCFFTENISQDDPFMLYATLHSGPKCMYMTRDMLRDHKARLDPEVHLSFIKWQRTHQMVPINFLNNKLICKPLRRHDTVIQQTEKSWHIPFENEDAPRFSYQVPVDWICAVKQ